MRRIANPLVAATLAAGVLGAGLLGVGPLGSGAAQAHSYLVASSPAADSDVTELPPEFSVTANELLLDLAGDASGFAIQVVDAAGRYYGDGCLVVSGSTLSMGATLGEPGDYRLYWQVVSADGHPVSGDFGFSWQPSAGQASTEGLGAPPVCGEDAEPTPTATPDPVETATPTPSATAIDADGDDTGAMIGTNSFVFIAAAVLGVLAAIAVIILAVRALRGLRRSGSAENDDTWNAPPSS
jgi:methionine-rich copper-binding protein CopC